jgi:hypothetical protein
MMQWSDETLMAFADGELASAQHAAIDAALATDAALRARVAAFQAQRTQLAAAFAGTLDEPVPDRLARLVRDRAVAPDEPQPRARVADLAAQRQRRRERVLPGWAQWGGMAASVVLGVWIGVSFERSATDAALTPSQSQLSAGGAIAQALSNRLASDPAAAGVQVQLSFVDRDGNYCRTFGTASVTGLACQQQGQWVVQELTAAEAAPTGPMRQAASALPAALLEAVDRRIAGDALDAAAERAARDRKWRR